MMLLQSENHSVQILATFQKKRNDCEIFISGNDNSRSQSDSLWILSPLVRSIIDSLGNIRDNLIILPDFSYDDIKTGLEVTEGNRGDVLMFNSSTKHLLETLGLDLRNCWNGGDSKSPGNIKVEIKTEFVESDEGQKDNNEDDSQKLLLDENPVFDISDDEEEPGNVTVKELASCQNIKAEKSDVDENNIENEDDDDDDDIQTQLMMDQDFSDSEEESDDESALQNDKFLDETSQSSENVQSLVNQNVLKKADTQDDRFDFQHQEKLKEVEQLLIRENGQWKCKACKKIFQKKNLVRRHAEIHVIGFSFSCNHCTERFGTRSRRWAHKQDKHRSIIEGERSSKNRYNDLDPNTRKIIHDEKLKEVESLLIYKGDLWKCKVCDKTFKHRSVLRSHAEIHVEGLFYPCQACSKICPNRKSLKNHFDNNHKVESKSSEQNYQSETTGSDRSANDIIDEIFKTRTMNNKEESEKSQEYLHQHKLREVEELLIKENGAWKCKTCQKTFQKKDRVRRHAELHVSDLSFPCKHCSEILTTRGRLALHIFNNHRGERNT